MTTPTLTCDSDELVKMTREGELRREMIRRRKFIRWLTSTVAWPMLMENRRVVIVGPDLLNQELEIARMRLRMQ